MSGTEIITYLANNAPTILSAIGPVVGSIITAVFLRSNTATTEFEKVKAGKFDEVIEELLASGQMTYTEFYKANNFLKIAKKADTYYSESSNREKDKTYDFDWFIRYYEASGNISDEKMQDAWARLLAGEVSNPSSFSLKTIDILRNMRKADAELFVKFCKYSVCQPNGQLFLPNYDEYLECNDIKYTDVMRLSEMGLIFSDGTITLNYTLSLKPNVIFINRDLYMKVSAKELNNTKLFIRHFPFTDAGTELASLVSEQTSDESFIEFGKAVAKNSKFNIGVFKLNLHSGFGGEHEVNLIEQ